MRFRVRLTFDKFWMALAWRLPKQVVYWSVIRLLTNGLEPPTDNIAKMLTRWRESYDKSGT